MQISNISNQPNFNGICAGVSRMNRAQRLLTNELIRSTEGAIKWSDVCTEGIDAVLLPLKEKSIKVRYLDRKSGEFYKDNGKFVETLIKCGDHIVERSDELMNTIMVLAKNITQQPKVNTDKIFNGKTTLFKLKPSLHKYLRTSYKELIEDGVKHSDAKKEAIDIHFMDIPNGGYNFNF